MTLRDTPTYLILTFCLLVPFGELQSQPLFIPARFQASTELVLVPVTVTDHYGKTITGLAAEDFRVFDDRSPQHIVSLHSDDAPCTAGIVLDTSGSMRYALGTAKDAAENFLETAGPQDEFLLLTVSTQPDAGPEFTNNVAAMEQNVEATQPGGMTALIDTVYLGLSRMREASRRRRALIVISDGVDNHSRYSKQKLLREAVEADVQIYTILLDSGLTGGAPTAVPYRPSLVRKPIDQGQQNQWPRLLEELAEKTGGLHFHVRNAAEAREAAIKTGQALRSQYVIGYHPPESASAGKWHHIQVKARVADVNVYARDGYYAR
jgi:Ca-activated chloride channel family protein